YKVTGVQTCALPISTVETGQQKSLNVSGAILARWSPHGERIAYSIRSKTGTEEIWTVPSAGGTPALVVTGSGAYWNPSWSPDGKIGRASCRESGRML